VSQDDRLAAAGRRVLILCTGTRLRYKSRMSMTPTATHERRRETPTGPLPPTLAWVGGTDGRLAVLDQTLLPWRIEVRDCHTAEQVWEAIRVLRVRGAPAIGLAAAYGACLGTRGARHESWGVLRRKLREVCEFLATARPTAINLRWAVRHVAGVAESRQAAGPAAAWDAMLEAAHALVSAEVDACRRIGEFGADLVPEGGGVLTHCNAGRLATVGDGTALAILYEARRRGRRFRVYVDETRPLLQGARLTALELHAADIEVTVICEGAAASLMRAGAVQAVVAGADRIAANGDTANKIGTYGLAVLARQHGIPFYVVAPTSTVDLALSSGAAIPIEERPGDEVRNVLGQPVFGPEIGCLNPAFDVTPAEFITALVCEKGLAKPVTEENIREKYGPGA
jgi:methylthioribose-1-phosphate isomerase